MKVRMLIVLQCFPLFGVLVDFLRTVKGNVRIAEICVFRKVGRAVFIVVAFPDLKEADKVLFCVKIIVHIVWVSIAQKIYDAGAAL